MYTRVLRASYITSAYIYNYEVREYEREKSEEGMFGVLKMLLINI